MAGQMDEGVGEKEFKGKSIFFKGLGQKQKRLIFKM